MNYSVNINGIDVDATYSDDNVEKIFIPLLQKLSDLQKQKNGRIVVFLAAPPGAGKSTLASFLEELSHRQKDLCDLQAVGMDGFHRRQEYLKSHLTEVAGKTVCMVDIKGAPVTFDLEKLTEAIRQVALGDIVLWPSYDRHLHNPVEGAYKLTGDIILIEGNYLLLDEEGWRDLKSYADYSIKITADKQFLRGRLIDRKIKSGNSKEKAEAFVDTSDMANVTRCLENTVEADLNLELEKNGEYHRE